MDEMTITIRLSEEPPIPPPSLWEKVVEGWNELSTIQKAIVIVSSFGSGAGIVAISKGGEKKVVE